mgnify:FL=1
MKKKLLTIKMLFVGTIVMLSSCNKISTEGETSITYYPTLSLEGESVIVVDKGTQFTEPGYSAILNGIDVTENVVVTSNIDVNKSGFYTITYTITNADGFAKNASRQIIVMDLEDKIEGFYTTTLDCYRMSSAGRTDYGKEFDLTILSNGDGTYTINDMLGGYYEQRAGYGSLYAMEGVFEINADGTIVGISGNVAGWGDSMDSLDDGTYDEATKTISWKVVYAGMDFYVTMKKQ